MTVYLVNPATGQRMALPATQIDYMVDLMGRGWQKVSVDVYNQYGQPSPAPPLPTPTPTPTPPPPPTPTPTPPPPPTPTPTPTPPPTPTPTPTPTPVPWQDQQQAIQDALDEAGGLGGFPGEGGMGIPSGANVPAPGSSDWWFDQDFGAQWLNRLMLGGQIGPSGVATNPYQKWAVDQSARARTLNMMQNLTTHGAFEGEGMTPFSSAQIPWGQGRQMFTTLAGMGPETPAGGTMAGLTPKETMGMAYTAGRGYLPELMRQQIPGNYENIYNRYLATAGSQAGAPGFSPWLAEYYGF